MKFINDLINNISNIELIDTKLNNLNTFDIPHINLYGHDGSLKHFYKYLIINNINNKIIHTKQFNNETINLQIKNNVVPFKILNHMLFKELNLYHKVNYEKHILKHYILPIIENKHFNIKKHIFIINDFDKLNTNSYLLLRRVMEKYVNNVLFIFTSNSISNIPDAIKSRCLNIRCPLLDNNKLLNIVNKIIKNNKIYNTILDNKFLKKIIKKVDNDIYKLLLNLEHLIYNNMLDSKPIILKDTLYDDILSHLKYLKKEKDIYKILPKNREFIYKLVNFNYDNSSILEIFLEIIINKYHDKLNLEKALNITIHTETNLISSCKEIFHYEMYLLKLYKLFHITD